jgi:integrase
MGKDYIWLHKREKRWYARVPYFDEGKRKYKHKGADDKSHAKRLAIELLDEFAERGTQAVIYSPKTFDELCDYYRQRYLIAPVYVGGHKVAGLRSYRDGQRKLKILRSYFGARRLSSITHGDILEFRTARFLTPVNRGHTQRSAATVNRELELLRTMFAVAFRESFIRRNPFTAGEPIIKKSMEHRRERVLRRDEESRLLAACVDEREHLKAILICALDTGMRRGEIFSLTWQDVDLATCVISIQAFNTKTLRARAVTMTQRLRQALLEMSERAGRIFGIENTVKRSFATAKRMAGIEDLRFHDLRHTAGTRLAEGGLHVTEIARVLGHTNVQTAYRYINTTENTTQRAAMILDEWQAKGSVESEAVN